MLVGPTFRKVENTEKDNDGLNHPPCFLPLLGEDLKGQNQSGDVVDVLTFTFVALHAGFLEQQT